MLFGESEQCRAHWPEVPVATSGTLYFLVCPTKTAKSVSGSPIACGNKQDSGSSPLEEAG